MDARRGARSGVDRGVTRCLNIAHRGASLDAPENTLEAFGRAVEQGADMIETDLHLLSDGAIAVYHDDTLDGSPIGELTREDVRRRRPDIPTLEEVLDVFGGVIPFNLELKRPKRGTYEGLETRVVDRLRSRGLLGSTLLSCFDDAVLARLGAIESTARLGLLVSVRARRRIASRAAAIDVESIHLHASLATAPRIASLRVRGYRVYVYTVDDPLVQRRLLACGVDGIFTNTPGRFARLLETEGLVSTRSDRETPAGA